MFHDVLFRKSVVVFKYNVYASKWTIRNNIFQQKWEGITNLRNYAFNAHCKQYMIFFDKVLIEFHMPFQRYVRFAK